MDFTNPKLRNIPRKGDEIRMGGKAWTISKVNAIPGGEFLASVVDMSGNTEIVKLTKQGRAAA